MGGVNYELIIITDFDLDDPSGAGYNRIMCYATALCATDISIKIISSKYSYKEGISSYSKKSNLSILKGKRKINDKTTFEDFHFYRIYRFLKESEKVLNLSITEGTIRVYYLYNSTFVPTLLSLIYYKIIRRRRLLIEKNELEIGIEFNKPIDSDNPLKKFALLFFRIILLVPSSLADLLPVFYSGLIVISSSLFKIYRPFTKKILTIPILADQEAFNHVGNEDKVKTGGPLKIGYFGNISEKKDGLFSLVESINLTKTDGIELFIYGTGASYDIHKLQKILKEIPQIKYCGLINADQVPKRMIDLDLLAFPRPQNLQTKFGFSTKLAEFLFSKIPVLTSDIGDNKLYLKDNENAFIIRSSKKISTDLLSKKLISIYNLAPSELRKIGYNGYLTANSYFNPHLYASTLKNFLFNVGSV
jgi:glycosyltransferase involved in cell wall biosynthesis